VRLFALPCLWHRPAVLKPNKEGLLRLDDFDWCVIRLGTAGLVREFEVDTNHFKGNAPESCIIEGADASSMTDADVVAGTRCVVVECLLCFVPSSRGFYCFARATHSPHGLVLVHILSLLASARSSSAFVEASADANQASPACPTTVPCPSRCQWSPCHAPALEDIPRWWCLAAACVRSEGPVESLVVLALIHSWFVGPTSLTMWVGFGVGRLACACARKQKQTKQKHNSHCVSSQHDDILFSGLANHSLCCAHQNRCGERFVTTFVSALDCSMTCTGSSPKKSCPRLDSDRSCRTMMRNTSTVGASTHMQSSFGHIQACVHSVDTSTHIQNHTGVDGCNTAVKQKQRSGETPRTVEHQDHHNVEERCEDLQHSYVGGLCAAVCSDQRCGTCQVGAQATMEHGVHELKWFHAT